MKQHSILSGLSLALACLCVPQIAGAAIGSVQLSGITATVSGATVNVIPGAFVVASSGSGHSGGSDDSGHHSGGSDDSGHHSGSSDDSGHHSGSSDDSDDSSDDDSSGSGRPDPRIPGGSGCDSAGDIQEHGGCSA